MSTETLPLLGDATASLPGPPLLWMLVGLVLLLAGRRLFWVVLGAAGFLAGMTVAMVFLEGEAPALVLGLGLLAGLIAAGLAIFVQKLAVAVAGFLVGGYGAVLLLGPHLGASPVPEWAIFVVAGVLAAILARMLFEWALIAVSALFGALLILAAATALYPDLTTPTTATVACLALTLLGALVQLSRLRKKKKE